MFGRIAPSYDALNHILSFGMDIVWRSRMAKVVRELSHAPRVLDLCTGTGDQAYAVLRKSPSARITGIDAARPMLTIGKQKDREGRVAFLQASALHLPFRSGAFDACFCAFGLRNLPNLPTALKEARRVLKPGGLLIVLEFFKPTGWFERLFYEFVAPRYVPRLGAWLAGDAAAYRYLIGSVGLFSTTDQFLEVLENAGFAIIARRRFFFGIAYGLTAQCR
jgi:demethylmenaquinone methyltransferase/2-methoxy-6-polyprenyl-1,4-benzoquinol methylase